MMIETDRQHIYDIYKAVKSHFVELKACEGKEDYKRYVEYCLIKGSIPYEKGRVYKMREYSGPNNSGRYEADFVCYSNIVVKVRTERDSNPKYNKAGNQLLSLQKYKLSTESEIIAGIQIDFSNGDLVIRAITEKTWEKNSEGELVLPEGHIVMSAYMVNNAIKTGGNLSSRQRVLLGLEERKDSGWKRDLIGAIVPERFYRSLVEARGETGIVQQHSKTVKPAESIVVKDDEVLLTKELLDRARTPRGGFNARQTNLFGIDWNTKQKGWLNSLVGKVVSKELYYKFIEYGKPANGL